MIFMTTFYVRNGTTINWAKKRKIATSRRKKGPNNKATKTKLLLQSKNYNYNHNFATTTTRFLL